MKTEKYMDFRRLNPVVRGAGLYEKISNSTPCRAYDARLIYLISGDIAVSVEDEKKFHLSVGNLLYIPAGARYSLKGKYLRAAVFSFDLTDEGLAESYAAHRLAYQRLWRRFTCQSPG